MSAADSVEQVSVQQGDYFYLRHLQEVRGNDITTTSDLLAKAETVPRFS